MKWISVSILAMLLSSTAWASDLQPVCRVPSVQPWVALTFDDGPDQKYTKEIVDILDRHREKATFFFVGERVLWYPDIAKYVVSHGHEIANHSFSHPNMRRMTEDDVYSEIIQAQTVLLKTVGKKSPWFRAPSGAYNQRVRKAADRAHVQLIGWFEDTRDWSNIGPNTIYRNALKTLEPGHIILFHDCCGQDRIKTARVLDRILTEIEHRGYRCVTISELLGQTGTQGHRQG